MGYRYLLRCLCCAASYLPEQVTYFCPKCELDGALDVVWDCAGIGSDFQRRVSGSAQFDMWRYRSLLPSLPSHEPTLHTGGSPLYRLKHAGPGRILIKDDSRNPSGSLKDRASAMAVALASGLGVRTVAAASTGNAASALACMCAGSHLECVIFAPNTTAREKLAQMRAYGARVVKVNGGYDEAFMACHEACRANGWYNRSTGINSFMSEGKKTVAFEICEQLHWKAPDRVFVPVGNGCIVGAVYKGFDELRRMGCIDHVPRVMGVQAAGSDYMLRAWESGSGANGVEVFPTCTAASSISVSLPRDRLKALRAIEASGGEFLAVSDTAIFDSVVALARRGGVFAEPGAAAAYAGALVWGAFEEAETSVIVITGSGLKDVSGLLHSGVLDQSAAE